MDKKILKAKLEYEEQCRKTADMAYKAMVNVINRDLDLPFMGIKGLVPTKHEQVGIKMPKPKKR